MPLVAVQMQFEGRKADLALFKERAEALQRAVVILEEGIAASRAQVHYTSHHTTLYTTYYTLHYTTHCTTLVYNTPSHHTILYASYYT